MLRRCCRRSMNRGRSPRRMKIFSSHNITTITTTMVGVGPSSWCLDIVVTITITTIITPTIAAAIESALRMIEKQDPRVLFFVCYLLQARFLLRRTMKMPIGPVKHRVRRRGPFGPGRQCRRIGIDAPRLKLALGGFLFAHRLKFEVGFLRDHDNLR